MIANRYRTSQTESGDGRTLQIVLGGAVLLRGFDLKFQRADFRVLPQGFENERFGVGHRRSDWLVRLDQLKVLLIRLAENRGEPSEGRAVKQQALIDAKTYKLFAGMAKASVSARPRDLAFAQIHPRSIRIKSV